MGWVVVLTFVESEERRKEKGPKKMGVLRLVIYIRPSLAAKPWRLGGINKPSPRRVSSWEVTKARGSSLLLSRHGGERPLPLPLIHSHSRARAGQASSHFRSVGVPQTRRKSLRPLNTIA